MHVLAVWDAVRARGGASRCPSSGVVPVPSPLTGVAAPPADELVNEKEKYKGVADEMDTAFAELSGY